MRPRQDAATKIEEGRRLFQRGEYEGAVAALTEAISLYPRSKTAHSIRAFAYERLGERPKAKADREAIAAIKGSPLPIIGDEVIAKNVEGRRLLEAGDPAAALSAFDEAIAAEPEFVDAYRNRAEAHRRLGNEAEAAADLEEASSIEDALRERQAAESGRPASKRLGGRASAGRAPGKRTDESVSGLFGLRLPWRRRTPTG